MLEYGAESWQGGRDYQEDSFCILDLPRLPGLHRTTLFAVADGMGGHAGGDVASTTVLRAVAGSWLQANPAGLDALESGIEAATKALGQSEDEDGRLRGLGSTLVAVSLTDAGIEWVSVGDSPLWILREGVLHRLNADHSGKAMLEQMVAAGELTEEQARQHPIRHQLHSAVTSSFPTEIDVSPQPTPLLPGDLVLLASDGIHTLDDEEIAAVCAAEEHPGLLCAKLLLAVEAKSDERQDNATVVAFRIRPDPSTETNAPARKPPLEAEQRS